MLSNIVNMTEVIFSFMFFISQYAKWIFKCCRSILSLTDVINDFSLRSYEFLHCGVIYGNAINCLELQIDFMFCSLDLCFEVLYSCNVGWCREMLWFVWNKKYRICLIPWMLFLDIIMAFNCTAKQWTEVLSC